MRRVRCTEYQCLRQCIMRVVISPTLAKESLALYDDWCSGRDNSGAIMDIGVPKNGHISTRLLLVEKREICDRALFLVAKG